LILFSFIALTAARAQDTPFTYTEIVKVDSVNRETLYLRVKNWIDSTYTSAKSVLQTDNRDSGLVILKAAFIVHVTDGFDRDGGNVTYLLSIQCKDGRYKLSLSDFIHHHGTSDLGDGGDLNRPKANCSPLNLPKYYWHQIKDQAAERRNKLIASVKSMLGSTPQTVKPDNW